MFPTRLNEVPLNTHRRVHAQAVRSEFEHPHWIDTQRLFRVDLKNMSPEQSHTNQLGVAVVDKDIGVGSVANWFISMADFNVRDVWRCRARFERANH